MVSPQNYWDTTVLWQQYFLISCNLKAKIWTTLNVTYLLRDNHVICSKIWDSLYSPYKLVAIMYIMYHFAEGFASYYENVGLLVCPNIMSAHIFCKDFFVRVGDHSVNRFWKIQLSYGLLSANQNYWRKQNKSCLWRNALYYGGSWNEASLWCRWHMAACHGDFIQV